MPSTSIIIGLGWFLAAGCLGLLAYWSMALWFIRLADRAMPRVRAGLDVAEPAGGWPKVSIVVPAHNEELFIDHALATLRQNRYPSLEIIIAADRCTDRTVEIVREHMAKAEGAIRLVEIDSCPEGWSGKCHASWSGARAATGEWLLFADADTTFHPDLVRAALGIAVDYHLDFLSLLGRLTATRPFELTDQPVAAMSLMKMYPIHRANRNDRPGRRAFANGQFMLFRKSVYESIGTHERIREAILEDLRFARRLNHLKHRMGLVIADDMFQVRMYETPEEFHSGWKRIFIEAANRNVPRLRAHVWRLRILAIAPAVQAASVIVGILMLAGNPLLAWTLIGAALISFVAQFIALRQAYRMQGTPAGAIWRFPLGCLHMADLLSEAAADLRHGRRIQWGSLHYDLKAEAE